MPLRPNQTFNLIVASTALALLAEGALLWKLSRDPIYPARPSAPIAAVPTVPPPLFVAPGLETAPVPPANAPASAPGIAPLPVPGIAAAPPKAAALAPDKRALAKTYFEAATAALARKDKEAALESFRNVVQIAPDHLPTRLNLALLYNEAKRPAEALPHLIKAVQLAPKNPAPRFELARTLLALKRPAEAIAPLRDVLRLAPKERAPREMLAQIYLFQKKPNAAYEQWALLARSEPRDVNAQLQAAGLAADALKRPADAEKWLRRAQAAAPRDPRAALLLGRFLLAQNKGKAAAQVLGKAAKARPDVFEIFPMLANARMAAGDLSGARGAIQSALLRLPKAKTDTEKVQVAQIEGGLHFTMGRIWGQSRKPKEAVVEFRRAAKILPRDAETQSMLALASVQSGDRKGAINALQTALQIDAKRAGDHRLLGQIFADTKNWSGANAQYATYMKLQPRDGGALAEWAQLAARYKKSDQELQIWAKLAALEPKNPLPHLQSGAALRDLKKPREALASFERALTINGSDPNALYEVARLQTQLKQSREAQGTWEKLILAAPGYVPAYSSLLESSAQNGNASGARLFLARHLAQSENPKALGEILRYYEKEKKNSEATALLADIVKRNPKSRAAKAALDSFQKPITASGSAVTEAPAPTAKSD